MCIVLVCVLPLVGYLPLSPLLKLFRQVISCFSLAVTSRLYLGFAVVSLLMEINSVFLHIRQLLLLSGWRNKTTAAGSSVTYSLISWLNIGTLLVFRVFTTGWMIRWLAAHSEHMPLFVFMMGAVGTSLISIMNAVLFYRLFRADFLINH
ncbi:TLC domain-containing protein 2-like isoform X1 [Xyrichtys novacula]|uniref:TLC domain-containing protein 2-like isoform X1 n=1 Tax=Xyrichtys novacula TaxID=13765 RepID=A0AAV1FU62_XYRNO|nr:TLC domain-containing protein 2-like isoform X1 [Xyrichtys novacula]